MVNFVSTVFYALTAMSIASTIAAPVPNPEPFGEEDYENQVRAFDDYEVEARALPVIADSTPMLTRSFSHEGITSVFRREDTDGDLFGRDLEERSKIGAKIGGFFKKAFKAVTSVLRREEELESRDLEERSKVGAKIGNFFKKAFKTVTSVLRRDEEQPERRGIFGLVKTAVKGITKGVEAAVHKKHHHNAAKAASAVQPSQSKRAYIDDNEY